MHRIFQKTANPSVRVPSWTLFVLEFGCIWISSAAQAEPNQTPPGMTAVELTVLQRAAYQYNEAKKYNSYSVEFVRGARAYHETLAAAGVIQDMVALGKLLVTGHGSTAFDTARALPFEDRDIPRGLELLKAAADRACYYESGHGDGKCRNKRKSISAILKDYYREGVYDSEPDPGQMRTCLLKTKIEDSNQLLDVCAKESSVRTYRMNGDFVQAQYWEERASLCAEEILKINTANNCN